MSRASEEGRAPSLGTRAFEAIVVSNVSQVATLLISIVAARSLGAANKGELSLVQTVAAGVVVVGSLGFGVGQMYHVGRDRHLRSYFLTTSYVVCGGSAVVAAVIVFGGASMLGLGGVGELGALPLALGAGLVPLVAVLYSQRQFLLTLGRFAASKMNTVAVGLVTLMGYLALTLIHAGSVTAYLGITVLAHVGVGAAFHRRLRAMSDGGFSSALARASLSFGWRHYLAEIMVFITNRIDLILLGFVSSTRSVGVYSVALGLAEVCTKVPYELGTLLFPAAAGGDISGIRSGAIFRKVVLISLALGVVVASGAGVFVEVLFGHAYRSAVAPLRILLIGTVCWSSISITWNVLSARGSPLRATPAFALGAAVEVAGVLALGRAHGPLGAAIGAVCGYVVASMVLLARFVVSEDLRAADLLPRWRDAREIVHAVRGTVTRVQGAAR